MFQVGNKDTAQVAARAHEAVKFAPLNRYIDESGRILYGGDDSTLSSWPMEASFGEPFLARSADRLAKERSMRWQQLKQLWKRLSQLQEMRLSRQELLMKLELPAQPPPRITVASGQTAPVL